VTQITEKLAALRERVARAAAAAARPASSVTIVAVTKSQPLEAVLAAHAAGQKDFAENYLQEATARITQSPPGCQWHFIGTLQANKTALAASQFDWVQTVTSLRHATRLSQQRPHWRGDLSVCLQLQPQHAAERSGVAQEQLGELAAAVERLPRLRLRGLMFMALPDLAPEALRLEFRRARAAFGDLQAAGHAIDTLSMGMSDDLELAIAEGSTMVRVGTALFGPRHTGKV
jgi:pyridoxal phosphate enzyme (YggS family)